MLLVEESTNVIELPVIQLGLKKNENEKLPVMKMKKPMKFNCFDS